MDNQKTTCLCDRCIEAIKSRGEPVFVGRHIWQDDVDDGEITKCEWCEEEDIDVYECMF